MGDVPDVMADGSAAFFSHREVPWHSLGTVLDDNVTLEQALKIGHLDYEVQKSAEPIQFVGFDGKPYTVPGKYATYREDPVTHKIHGLGVVGSKHTPVQNVDAFKSLIDIAAESGASFETGGTMRHGAQAWLTLMFPEEYLIGGVDAHRLYLFAWNTHDGSGAIKVVVTDVRVVCKNTAEAAWLRAQGAVSIRHTSSAPERSKQVAHTLGITTTFQQQMVEAAEALLAQPMTDKQFNGFVDRLFPIGRDTKRSETLTATRREGVKSLWKAPTQQNIAGTRYAALNAVTEWADWFAPVKGAKVNGADKMRAIRLLNGGTRSVKTRAYALLAK